MAGEALFVGWGAVVRGREAKSLEIFQEAVEFWGGHMQAGKIESFEPVLLNPHGGDLAGFFLIKGELSAIQEIQASDGYRRINTRAAQIVDSLGLIDAVTGEALAETLQEFREAAADLGG